MNSLKSVLALLNNFKSFSNSLSQTLWVGKHLDNLLDLQNLKIDQHSGNLRDLALLDIIEGRNLLEHKLSQNHSSLVLVVVQELLLVLVQPESVMLNFSSFNRSLLFHS